MNMDSDSMVRIKDLKQGEFFTLKPIAHPNERQVFVRREYDRSERKYWAQRWSDISDGKYIKGDTRVYTDFIF